MGTGVAVIGGTGHLGPGLALRFAAAGIPVIIGSRDAARAEAAAADVTARLARAGREGEVTWATNADAAARCDTAVLSVPYDAQADLLPALRVPLAGKVVVSTTVGVRFDERGPVSVAVDEGSAAEQVARLLDDSRVAGAFHTVSSADLRRLDRVIDADVLVTADDEEARRAAVDLVGTVASLRAVDAGPLRNARLCEELTVLLLALNRIHHALTGVRITGMD